MDIENERYPMMFNTQTYEDDISNHIKEGYSITLSDGTKLEALTLNGNAYITTQEISEDTFTGKMKPVIISDGEKEVTYSWMDLVHFYHDPTDETYHFTLSEVSPREQAFRETYANVDFLMMASPAIEP